MPLEPCILHGVHEELLVISLILHWTVLPFSVPICSEQNFELLMSSELQRSIGNNTCHRCTVPTKKTKEPIF